MQNRLEDQQRSLNGCEYGTGFFGGKFLPFHRGHLDCILRCASECEKIYVVLMHNGPEERDILADYRGPFPKEHLSAHVRELALRAELAPFGNIEVISYDCLEADERAMREGKHPWFYECKDLVRLMGHFDVAYSSEPKYSRYFAEFYPWARAELLDERRSRNPISATEIRSMPFCEAYRHLPREYQKLVNKKVLFTGPESCGKSTLVRKLAAVLNTSYTEEMGKLACERFGVSSPGAEMYPRFVHEQAMADTRAVAEANMVALCDTDAIVTELYLRMLEGVDAMPLARQVAAQNNWDLVFFVEPTVPWVEDGLRVCAQQEAREEQSRMLKEAYGALGYRLVTLDGDYRENYERALSEIEALIGKQGCNLEGETTNANVQ
ncbi:MAG: hypothetical protein E7Z99_00440 [Coriobacteriaceae bacterium]|nr:hypothetical protein [Coriobacteriaceae bacterium]